MNLQRIVAVKIVLQEFIIVAFLVKFAYNFSVRCFCILLQKKFLILGLLPRNKLVSLSIKNKVNAFMPCSNNPFSFSK